MSQQVVHFFSTGLQNFQEHHSCYEVACVADWIVKSSPLNCNRYATLIFKIYYYDCNVRYSQRTTDNMKYGSKSI
jgi:hypothetical protein